MLLLLVYNPSSQLASFLPSPSLLFIPFFANCYNLQCVRMWILSIPLCFILCLLPHSFRLFLPSLMHELNVLLCGVVIRLLLHRSYFHDWNIHIQVHMYRHYSTIILSNQLYYLCKLKFCDKGTTFVTCIIGEIKFKMWAHEGAIRILNNRTTYFHFL